MFVKKNAPMNRPLRKKNTILSMLHVYMFSKKTKKSYIKKLRKFYFVRPKTFFKQKNRTTKQSLKMSTLACNFNAVVITRKKNSLKNVYKKARVSKSVHKSLSIINAKALKNLTLNNNGLKKFKFEIFKTLLTYSKQIEMQSNVLNNVYVSNLSLLNTSSFRANKFNYAIIKGLQALNKSDTNVNKSNFLKTEIDLKNHRCLTLSNYAPLIFFAADKNSSNHNFNGVKHANMYTSILNQLNTPTYKSFLMFYVISFLEHYVGKKF